MQSQYFLMFFIQNLSKSPFMLLQDYEGQKLAERLFHVVILFFAAVGFVWGYYIQQFGATIIIVAAGFIVSCVLVLPPWPMYRKHALEWQKPRPENTDTKREGGKKKQK